MQETISEEDRTHLTEFLHVDFDERLHERQLEDRVRTLRWLWGWELVRIHQAETELIDFF